MRISRASDALQGKCVARAAPMLRRPAKCVIRTPSTAHALTTPRALSSAARTPLPRCARLTHGYLDTFRILGLSVFRIRILALPCIQYSGAVCGYRCISALCIQYADTGCIRHNYTGNSDVLCIIRIMYCILRIICIIPPRIIGRKAMLIWNPMKSKTCPVYMPPSPL